VKYPVERAMAALTLLATLACGRGEAPEPVEAVRPVKAFTFGEGQRIRSFGYPGRVFANQTVEVAFEVTGKLDKLPVSKGQEASPGDILASLDPRDFRNELAASKAALDESIATRDRYRVAARTNAVSRQDVDQAEAASRIAAAEVRIKQKALDDTIIRADFEGIVADRFVDNFQNVVAKQPILLYQDVSQLEIRISVPERDVATAADEPGRMTASFDARPGEEIELSIKEFVTEADPVTQTYEVILVMPNPKGSGLLPGMTASVNWYPPAVGRLGDDTVPIAGVLGQKGRPSWVWVIDPAANTVSRREVEVGPVAYADRVEILGGLERGEMIAAAGAHHLSDGMRVRPYGQ
jgi:RND family efflux transporter MFP subunit